jgi:hypothetical protein
MTPIVDPNRVDEHLHDPLRRRPAAEDDEILFLLYVHVKYEPAQPLKLHALVRDRQGRTELLWSA